jgi:hypothetical protein
MPSALTNGQFQLSTNFLSIDRKDEIYHYSSKEHPKISKIAKFGFEICKIRKI